MKSIQLIISTLFTSLTLTKETIGTNLWCYQCNNDLSMGHKGDCNDPYAPGPAIDLVACPDHESHHCLKALIYYQNVHATVRGCVPSRSTSNYCIFNDIFPEALITCTFCQENSCNRSPSEFNATRSSILIMILSLIIFAIIM